MNQQLHPYPNQHKTWQWPFDLTQYDRNPVLSETESAELNRQFWLRHQVRSQNKTVLHRLVQPIDDVLTFLNASDNIRRDTIRFMIIAIHRRGTPFWAWSVEEWVEILCPTATAFNVSYGRRTSDYHNDNRARRIFPIIAYLLCSLPTIEPLLHLVAIHPLARKVFGDEAVNEAVQQLTTILKSWGYHLKHTMDYFTGCICYLLLQNRSPYLEDLTSEFLELAQQTCTITCVRTNIYRISRGLSALGITNKPLPTSGLTMPEPVDSSVSMSEEWLSWCQRWREQSPQPSHKSDYNPLLQVGRWLKVSHPEVTSPAHWTYELAAEFVAMVSDMKVGDWIDQNNHLCVKSDRIGQPMRPNTKAKMLKAMRVFLRDCQDWGWIPVQLNPYRALGTPHSLKKLIGPDPQVIDKEFWAKILWAAMNLQADDLLSTRSDAHIYPLELVRAIAMVWCFTALRSNEIWRLRVGCIRWQTEDVLVPETGGILPRDAVCFLDIPVNKTMTSYTKAVHPLVGKRINEWERVRPQEQPHVMDRKTSETVQFLFSYRGVHISKEYINHSLIPLLCRKAGIPEQDSRGTITSHRARATIASMLYNAKEPLNIFELKEYLGHRGKYGNTTTSGMGIAPTRFGLNANIAWPALAAHSIVPRTQQWIN